MRAETKSERDARELRLRQPPPKLVQLASLIVDAKPILRAVAHRKPLNVELAAELLRRIEKAGG